MLTKLCSSILCALLLSSASALAENSLSTAAIIQLQQKSFCGEVTEQDIERAGFHCFPQDRLKSLSTTSADFFEWNTFQVAAKEQVLKNKCMTEQADLLMSDPELKKIWYTQLTQAWIGAKKAQLILDICNRHIFSQLEPATVKRFGVKEAYEKASSKNPFGTRAKIDEKWLDICADEKQVSALKAASGLFQFALPIISDPQFFETIETHRKMVLNTSTQKPLSDSDILNLDMHDISNLKLTKSDGFEAAINKDILNLAEERREVTTSLERSKKSGHYQLSTDLKDYIYEDQTLLDTLKNKNLLGQDGSADGNPMKASRGSLCLLSKYENTATAQIGGFVLESAFMGKLITSAGKLAKAAKAPKTFGGAMSGLTLRGYMMVYEEVQKSCPDPNFGDKTRFKKKTIAMAGGEDAAAMKAADLPEDFEYARWELKSDPKKVPSCKKGQKNFLVNSLYQTNCLLDSLLTVAPLKVSLPLVFTVGH